MCFINKKGGILVQTKRDLTQIKKGLAQAVEFNSTIFKGEDGYIRLHGIFFCKEEK